jgi:hypothetical protein
MRNGARWSEDDLKRVERKRGHATPRAPKTPKANKFNAQKTTDADSGKESRRLKELRLLEKAGQIHDLIPQVTFHLMASQIGPDGKKERAVMYTCDAMYVENGQLVVEDTKSPPTRKLPAYVLKRKLMLEKFNIQIKEN